MSALVFAVFLFVPCLLAQDAAALYRQGVDKQRQGDLAGAAALYRKSLGQDESNVAARSNLGAALVGLGRYDEAIPEYESALKASPPQVAPYLQKNLALAYYKSGRMQQAAPLLLALHDFQPANREAAMLAADCLVLLGEPAKALAILEPLAGEASGDKAFSYLLGMAYLKTGKSAEAQRVLDPVLKDTSSAESNYALGLAIFTSGDYPAAIKPLERAIQLNPTLPHVYSYYGQTLMITGDADGALAAFAKQFAADPNDFDANFKAAAILARRGHATEAEPLLRRAILLRPDSAGAHLALGQALAEENKGADARKELESDAHRWPEFGAAHMSLAELYAKAGLNTEAARERALGAKFASKSVAAAAVGPAPGTLAPPLKLPLSVGGGSVDIQSPERGKPTVLVFGSYSCPNFRRASPVLNDLSKTYAGKAGFLLVYIREAHAADSWQSTINERENVQVAPVTSVEQKHDYAMMCERKLHLRFPSAVDGLDNAAEKAYSAWPSRVYVISADGHVRYSSALIEEEFDQKALEAAVKSVVQRGARR